MRVTRRYAETTTVPVERSQHELGTLLRKAGAEAVMTAWDATQGAGVRFRMDGVYAQLIVPHPSPERMATLVKARPRTLRVDLEEQEERRCWRALLLLVKAKLEAIAGDITTMEREFMPDLLLSDGRRLEQWAAPALAEMYQTGRLPALPAAKS